MIANASTTLSRSAGDESAGRHQRFEQIDVLRGVAALTVVFSHYLPYWDRYFGNIPVLVPNIWGNHAVKLFFIVSGFVIFFTLERCRTVTDFALYRFSKLYPVYWTALAIATAGAVGLFDQALWPGGLLANATMFQEFLGVDHLDNVYWSLSVELAFYLNCAWLLALGWHRRPGTVVLVWLVASALYALTVHEPDVKPRDMLALFFALDYASYFAMGIVYLQIHREGWSRMSLALIVLAIAVQGLMRGPDGLIVACVTGGIFALALAGYLNFTINRITLWLGTISYALYLIHRNLGYLTLDWLYGTGVGPFTAISATIAGALLLATVLTYGVERPASRRLRRWYRTHQTG